MEITERADAHHVSALLKLLWEQIPDPHFSWSKAVTMDFQ